MVSDCTSCGHPVPEGQFRCGRCGAPRDGDETDETPLASHPLEDADHPPPADPQPPGSDDIDTRLAKRAGTALSLPPLAPEENLDLEPAPPAQVPEPDPEPAVAEEAPNPFKGHDAETEKRKVPKGAFGEGSIVDKLPTHPPEGDELAPEAQHEDEPPRATEASGAIATSPERLPGLEPTRHRDDEDSAAQPLQEPKQVETGEAVHQAAREETEPDLDLDLDVPSGGLRSFPNKPHPPFLASEIMRGDIIPEQPATHRIARLAQGCGAAAVVTYAALAPARPDAILWGLPALALLALGVLRLGYVQRASALAVLALGTCAAAGWTGAVPGQAGARGLLPPVLLWLSASLLLRSWYRGHRQPPWMVTGGVVAAALIAAQALSRAGPWVLHGAWQSWLPALVAFTFVLLCLLSLLALMGRETGAGGVIWAVAWWIWYGVGYWIVALAAQMPARADTGLTLWADAAAQSAVVMVFLLPPGALALAQLYAVTLSRREPATDDAHVEAAAAE